MLNTQLKSIIEIKLVSDAVNFTLFKLVLSNRTVFTNRLLG